jgi:toxin ParE1/3/4
MEIVVIWSESAINDLRDIYDYFYFKAEQKTADNLVNKIVDKTIFLEQSPWIGQQEELLIHLQKEIRYLIQGNYKIVYLFENNIATVITVFDCRQNPES